MTEATNNTSERAAAFAACPESGCDWSSFYQGWKAKAAHTAPPAAAVAIPERMSVPGPIWSDGRKPYGDPLNKAEIAGAGMFNLALDEVARLNPAPVEQRVVPEGYVLVPVEPTTDMFNAGYAEDDDGMDCKAIWAAMLSAAPTPEPLALEHVGHQYQGRDGLWCTFMDQRHYESTVADGSWPIRAIYAPAAPEQPVKEK